MRRQIFLIALDGFAALLAIVVLTATFAMTSAYLRPVSSAKPLRVPPSTGPVFSNGTLVQLRWSPVWRARNYRLTIVRSSTRRFSHRVSVPVRIGNHGLLLPGDKIATYELQVWGRQFYRWRVVATMVSNGDRILADHIFLVGRPRVGRPRALHPRDRLRVSSTRTRLCWSKVLSRSKLSYVLRIDGHTVARLRRTCYRLAVRPGRTYTWSVQGRVRTFSTYVGPLAYARFIDPLPPATPILSIPTANSALLVPPTSVSSPVSPSSTRITTGVGSNSSLSAM